ncbi:MAG: MBL fold metallo-hydrolase [Thermoplasmata archaeon]|nr:MAG: MBL fold metallo-hydrolase [Thermoplasmata archaeon]
MNRYILLKKVRRIHCIYGRNYDSNIYIILGEIPTIVDTGTGLHHDEVIKNIKRIIDPISIKQIFLTHEHYDHCGGVRKIKDLTHGKAKIIAHKNAADKIERGESAFAALLGGEMPKIPVDQIVVDGDILQVGDEKCQVIHTPGHTPGSICLYLPDSRSLISGDTVFAYGSFGRYDFPGGSLPQLKKSIRRLATLDVVNLYPGHDVFIEGEGRSHIMMSLRNIELKTW